MNCNTPTLPFKSSGLVRFFLMFLNEALPRLHSTVNTVVLNLPLVALALISTYIYRLEYFSRIWPLNVHPDVFFCCGPVLMWPVSCCQLLLSGFALLSLCVWTGRRLNITAEADCRRLHCALRDLSSLLQAVGRLAEFFTGDVFTGRFNDALAIMQRSVPDSQFLI